MTFCLFSGAMIDCLSFEKRGSSSGHLYGVSVSAERRLESHWEEPCHLLDLFLYLN
jgi:hypothetical protein